MLFNRKIERSCSYCHYGTALGYGEIACTRRGIMAAEGSCNAFRYEPTKREPQSLPELRSPELTDEDFAI